MDLDDETLEALGWGDRTKPQKPNKEENLHVSGGTQLNNNSPEFKLSESERIKAYYKTPLGQKKHREYNKEYSRRKRAEKRGNQTTNENTIKPLK